MTVSKGLCEERLAMIEINRQAQGINRRCRQFYPTNSGAQSDTSLDSVNNKPAKVKRFLVKKCPVLSSDPYQRQRQIDGESIIWYEQEVLSTMMRDMREHLGRELGLIGKKSFKR